MTEASTPHRSWPALLVVGALAVVESTPGADHRNLAVYVAGAVVGLVWTVRFARWALTEDRSGSRMPWLTVPVVAAMAVGLVWADLPLRLRFGLARDDFDDAASAIVPDSCDAALPARLATYRLDGYTTVGSSVFFHTGTFLFDDFGFVHLPSGGPAVFDDTDDAVWWTMVRWNDLGDGWYEWEGKLPTNPGFGEHVQCPT